MIFREYGSDLPKYYKYQSRMGGAGRLTPGMATENGVQQKDQWFIQGGLRPHGRWPPHDRNITSILVGS